MDRAEYWILDAIAEGMWLLGTLKPDIVQMAFNRPGHGLDYDALIGLLDRLFRDGDLVADRVSLPNWEDSQLFVPTREEIVDLLAVVGGPDVFYGLTAQGGARWEAVSAPDWERFSDCWWGDPDWWGGGQRGPSSCRAVSLLGKGAEAHRPRLTVMGGSYALAGDVLENSTHWARSQLPHH